MSGSIGKFSLVMIAGALAVSGCATTGSVKRAQARADDAYGVAESGVNAAQHAQGSADSAYAAAQRAQSSADAAGAAAASAGNAAQAAGMAAQGTTADVSRLNARVRRLEVETARLRRHSHHHHHHHDKKTVTPRADAQFHAN